MTSRHYDVVVVGRSIGALAAAALLARRDFRTLVIGQGQKPASYRFEGRTLRRRSFTFLAATSPMFRRMLHELSQTQVFRRRLSARDPMFSVIGEGYRLEIPPSIELFAREIDREFPEVRAVVDEMYALFASANASLDQSFDRDVVWPPGTLWERFETGRAAATLPLGESDADAVLGKFPAGHPYRDVTLLPAHFASDLAPASGVMPALALARLHGSWTRGVQALAGGEDELESFLVERLVAHGAECRLDQRALSVVVRGKTARGILEDGQETPTSADSIILDCPGEDVAELSRGEGISRSAEKDWPRVTALAGRFVVSLVVKAKGIPSELPEESFLLPRRTERPDPRRLVVHLQRPPARDADHPDEALLVAEAIVPKRGTLTLLEARESILNTVYESLPFLERHLVMIDSPHDGLPLYDYTSGARREIDRIHLTESKPGPEPMQWLWSIEPRGYLRLGGEPVRGPVPGTYLVGSTVLPALGQEGQLIAAASAARLVTRKDRAREKLRRDMWTKIETG
ncbi:MAG TPA: NAD(P)-binding protein [Polyangiaceae bacterium]|jgi:phytoene dehydrogenase-like protein|nr:NAD(P)-binding protein [Polyangiaceae bacterium]